MPYLQVANTVIMVTIVLHVRLAIQHIPRASTAETGCMKHFH